MGDHTEAIQIDYDPNIITFKDLLEIFWDNHSPCYPPYSKQYMAAIFYHNAQQKEFAELSLEAKTQLWGKRVWTKILPLTDFTLAEDYHQKYYLRKLEGVHKLLNIKSEKELVHSPVATKLNAYLHGHGQFTDIETYVKSIPGLEQNTRDIFLSAIARHHQIPSNKGGNQCRI